LQRWSVGGAQRRNARCNEEAVGFHFDEDLGVGVVLLLVDIVIFNILSEISCAGTVEKQPSESRCAFGLHLLTADHNTPARRVDWRH